MKTVKLWTRNFRLVIFASAIGTLGAIAGGFALAFLVFDETGSTLASALIVAIQLLPYLLLPVLIAPFMDRLPRKSFLVAGDAANAVLLAGMGIWLLFFDFSYVGYLAVSLLLACLGAVDELAFTSIYPELIPEGAEQKGYAVSSMLYPVLKVAMTPAAAFLYDKLGVADLLLIQAGLSFLAAFIESRIRVRETRRQDAPLFSLRTWWNDLREAAAYLRQEPGLRSLFDYMAVTNGVAMGASPLLVAFFRTAPGFTAAMYSFFSVAEFAGRSLGGAVRYRRSVPRERRFAFTFLVYQVYETMDALLLWLPYPLMLANRAVCGFLGINSAAIRQAAVQRYLPEQLRARMQAWQGVLITAAGSLLSLLIGALGEVISYRLCMTVCGLFAMGFCWLTVFRRRSAVRQVLEGPEETEE